MPLAALEALLDPVSDAGVRGLWSALDAAGLPSQAQHRGDSNAPHLTLVSAPGFDDEQLVRAIDVLAPLIPLEVEVSGYVLFGDAARHTLALLCAVSSPLSAAVELLAAGVRAEPERVWVPHITLARRLTSAQVARALEVLGEQDTPRQVTVSRVRHWDPVARTVTAVIDHRSGGLG